jgi:hypothetical protein
MAEKVAICDEGNGVSGEEEKGGSGETHLVPTLVDDEDVADGTGGVAHHSCDGKTSEETASKEKESAPLSLSHETTQGKRTGRPAAPRCCSSRIPGW